MELKESTRNNLEGLSTRMAKNKEITGKANENNSQVFAFGMKSESPTIQVILKNS